MTPALWPCLNGSKLNYISSPPPLSWRKKFKRRLVVLGSTGSIGQSTLSIVEKHPDRFHVIGLAGGKNIELLAKQALLFHPSFLAVLDDVQATRLKTLLPSDYKVEILIGPHGYALLASLEEADIVVSAQVGAAGLPATLAAALAGKTIALANKETLVIAGNLLREVCQSTGASILPLDSEHFAIFQCLAARGQNVSRLVLTASGGPFRTLSKQELQRVTAIDALKHPNWSMGKKISIDSATMMNKCLEIIEAHHLFGVSPDRIEVLIHPQSIIHSMIVLDDNSMLGQLAVPDMRVPIASCLFWPHIPEAIVPAPDLTTLGNLSFENPDTARFPGISLAKQAINAWPKSLINSTCLILNAANEMAVELFLLGRCHFNEIYELVNSAISALSGLAIDTSIPDWKKGNIPEIAESVWKVLRNLDMRSRNFVKECVVNRSILTDGEQTEVL